jgi:hypothetical protein
VTRITAEGNDPRTQDEMWVSAIRESSPDELHYPGMVLMGIRALATDQLSGANLNITADIEWGETDTMGYKNLVAADKPLAFYRFNDPNLSQCFDSSGRANHGTYSGTPVVQKPTLIKKSRSKSALFAVGQEVQTPALTLGDEFTLEAWIKPPTPDATHDFHIFSKNDGSFIFAADAFGGLSVWFSGAWHSSAQNLLIPNAPNYVAYRVKNGTSFFVINGVRYNNAFAVPTGVIVHRVAQASGQNWTIQAAAAYDFAIRTGRFGQRWAMGTSKSQLVGRQHWRQSRYDCAGHVLQPNLWRWVPA